MTEATMSGDDKPAPAHRGLLNFLDSKFGFWLATTLLVAVWGSTYAAVDRYLHKEEADKARAAEAARRDMDAVLKVVPLLFAPEDGQQDLGVKLLLSLRSKKAIEEDSLALVQAVLDTRLKAGTGASATDNDRRQASIILKAEDSERVAAIASPAASAPAAIPAARQLNDAVLPLRVYLQIGDEADRETARRLRKSLSNANVVAPGIELVDARRTPARSDLRYCAGKVAPDALGRIQAALQQASLSAEPKPLSASACERVRFNHVEIWLQRGAAG
jgi:hypothetical protein